MKFQQVRCATVILTYGGKKFLVDPWLADKGTIEPVPSPYNENWNPLVDLPLPISDILADTDAVIVTHMHHFDHFGEAAQNALPKSFPIFTQSEKEAQDMRDLGFENVTALLDEGLDFEGVMLFRTECEHGRGEAAEKNYEAMGIPKDACGVVFTHLEEKTFYLAGDTLWGEPVKDAISKYTPDIILLNAARAEFADGTPILMGTKGLSEVAQAAPEAIIITSHLDAVNHARLTRNDIKQFIAENNLSSQVRIPDDGEVYAL